MNLFSGLVAEHQRCDHEWEYCEDTIGDYGVVNGTYTERYMECSLCGERKEADYSDIPCYDDLDYWDE